LQIWAVKSVSGAAMRKMSMEDVVGIVAADAHEAGAAVVYGDQREAAALTSLFAQQRITLITFAWSEPSKQAAFSLMRATMRNRKLSICEHEQLQKEMLACQSRLMPSGALKYTTNGLDHLSAVVTLFHAVLEQYVGLEPEADLRRFRDPDNLLLTLDQQERVVMRPEGIAIIRGGLGRYPSALEY